MLLLVGMCRSLHTGRAAGGTQVPGASKEPGVPLAHPKYLIHPPSWHKLSPKKYELARECSLQLFWVVISEIPRKDSRCLYLSGASGCSTRVSRRRSASRTLSSQ